MNWSHVCEESLSIPYPQVKTVPAALLFFEFCLIYLSNFLIAQFMTNLNASGGALVRLRLAQCVVPVLTHAFQIAASSLCAITSTCLFISWKRLPKHTCRASVWKLYGVFCVLVCTGSILCAATWAFKMDEVSRLFNVTLAFQQGNIDLVTLPSLFSSYQKAAISTARYSVLYSLEFALVIGAKFLVNCPATLPPRLLA